MNDQCGMPSMFLKTLKRFRVELSPRLQAGDFLLQAVKDRLPEYLFYPTLEQPALVLASLGNDAGIIGAAMLGKKLFENR